MGKAGGGGLFLAGLFLVFLGFLISSDILARLLDILGFVIIVLGAILGIVGLIKMFAGGGGEKSSSSDW